MRDENILAKHLKYVLTLKIANFERYLNIILNHKQYTKFINPKRFYKRTDIMHLLGITHANYNDWFKKGLFFSEYINSMEGEKLIKSLTRGFRKDIEDDNDSED